MNAMNFMDAPCRTMPVKEVAKLVRVRLRKLYPKTTFKVVSSVDGYCSMVDVTWMDGPTWEEGKRIVEAYQGRMFDSLIDMSYYVHSWLLPDGSAQPAYSPGTMMCRGSDKPYEYPQPHPDAELVSFHCYVSASRRHSSDLLRCALGKFEEENGTASVEVVPERVSDGGVFHGAYLRGDYSKIDEIMRISHVTNTEQVNIPKEPAS